MEAIAGQMTIQQVITSIIVAGCLVSGCRVESIDGQLDALLDPLRAADSPGVAIAVIRGDELLVTRTVGLTDPESGVLISSSTNFRLASVTKQFTAAAILLLIERGDLQLATTLTEVFEQFPSYGSAVQIQHLLTHTSGLVDYEDVMSASEEKPILDAGVLTLMQDQVSTYFAPGSEYRYSNSAYAILAQVIEARSGKSFATFLRDNIFAPAGMENTVAYEKGISSVTSRAFGHSMIDGHYERTDQSSTSSVLGDGGVYSSLDDLQRWYSYVDSGELLPPKVIDRSTTRQPGTTHADDAGYGYGWFVETYAGHKNVRHSGSTIGFRNDIERFPDLGLTVIVLSNRNETDAQDLARSIAELYLIT